MSERWTHKEVKTLVQTVEKFSGRLLTKKNNMRKTFPKEFWHTVALELQSMGFTKRSGTAYRKKFQSLGIEIQQQMPDQSYLDWKSRYEPKEYETQLEKPMPKVKNVETAVDVPYISVDANQSIGKALGPVFFLDEIMSSRGIALPGGNGRRIRIDIVTETIDKRIIVKVAHWDPRFTKNAAGGE